MPTFLTFILRPAVFFAVTVLLFIIQRYCFILFYPEIYSGLTGADHWAAIYHGLSMDASMAGYLTIIPLLLSMVCVWLPERKNAVRIQMAYTKDAYLEMAGSEALLGHKAIRIIILSYSILVALAMSFIAILDGSLYPVWGYKLDLNPFFYFFTSPKTVWESISGEQLAWGIGGIIGCAALWATAYIISWNLIYYKPIFRMRDKILTFLGLVLMGGLLFVTIRGGVTVSTMNLSRAYFSPDQRLNHAAINPAFSLLSASTRNTSGTDKYNFFPAAQLPELLSMVATPDMETDDDDITDTYLATNRPNIILIILESFSSHLLPSQGGEPIAQNIDREAKQGLLFTKAYANGFRTDRGLPAILNGFPGIPDIGITRTTDGIERLPSLAGSLKKNGYATNYYYGGDINFTNMNALLVVGGFDNIISDKNFPYALRSAKWGVLDHHLFNMVKEDMGKNPMTNKPSFTVIQTSSSHEPFKVPFQKFENPAANAFAYTDSVVGDFMKELRHSPQWANTLVIMVPDHYGAYPENLADIKDRHHIPIIFTGGALKVHGTDDILMSQVDIAPTLLTMMDIDSHKFFFGRNVLDRRNPPMIYIYDKEWAYLQSTEGNALLNTATMETEKINVGSSGIKGVISPFNPLTQLQAWLQALADAYTPD